MNNRKQVFNFNQYFRRLRRLARVVEEARLESVYTGNRIEGSNPSVSAMERFYVYVLQCLKDFSFYIGQCDDLDCRMSKHTEGLQSENRHHFILNFRSAE